MKRKKGKLHYSLLIITLLPMFCLWLVISIVSINKVKEIMTNQVESNLQTIVYAVTSAYAEMYEEGEYYFLEEEGQYYIMKGEVCLNFDSKYIGGLKEKTGMDITFFNGDTRVLTTLKDDKGNYLTGTTVKNIIKKTVVDEGKEYFVENVYIGDVKSFSYYAPLYNPDGSIAGMLGISEPAYKIEKSTMKVIVPMLFVTVILMILAGAITAVYSEKIVKTIEKTKNFLSKVAVGNLSCTISEEVINRTDEIGDIGRSAVNMQKSLKDFVEKDGLTGLLNRRYGQKAYDEVHKKSEETGEIYSVALGDIDFFKKVNDTYGHDSGDMVLKEVSKVLVNHMAGKGHAVRWGGEEFLLIFRGIGCNDAYEILESILKEIRRLNIETDSGNIKVTMTFGVIGKTEDSNIINEADKLLYYGKESGRNRIVRSEDIGRQTDKG